jgi:protein-disulfide isomerase/uncharacterized membrane protein
MERMTNDDWWKEDMRATQRSKRAQPATGNALGGPLPVRTGNADDASRNEAPADDALPAHHTTVIRPTIIRQLRTVPPRRTWLAGILLVSVGLLASAILVGRFLELETSPWPRTLDLCSALFSVSCDPALSDERFRILSVPIAGWGVVYFSTLASLLCLGRSLGRGFAAEAQVSASLLAFAGAAAGVALSLWSWIARAAFCPLCLLVQAILCLLPFPLRQMSGLPLREQGRLLRRAAVWIRGRGETTAAARWKLVGFACAALVAAVTYQWVYMESVVRHPHTPPDRTALLAAYGALPQVDLPVAATEPHLGPLDAPVQLVVFASFRCPGCRLFAPTLDQMHRRFGDRLLIVYKHYPLSTECNARLTEDRQPGACAAAWAAEAAHDQGQFWKFHDALFAAGTDASTENVAQTVLRLHLDPARFEADRQAEATKERVAQDVELGTRLQIPGTPAVFVDGRLVHPATAEVLAILIRSELDTQAAGSKRLARSATRWFRVEGRPS